MGRPTPSTDEIEVPPDVREQPSKAEVIEAFARHVSAGKAQFYRSVALELVMGEREGASFVDVSGRRLLNAHCNGGVFNLGHRNPRVIAALTRGLERFDVGNHHLISEARALLAAELAAAAPGDLDRVVFASGGGEAIDFAIKLARAHTGRSGVVSALGGYHGHTGLALAAGDAQYREPFEPLAPGFSQVPFDDVEAMDAAIGDDTAAVILEPIPATLGMVVPSEAYLARVAELCRERGALLVADEVQTGLGRTGRMWAVEHFGVVPDMIVTAKGLGGGLYPIAATIYREPIDAFMKDNAFIHVSTGGGAEIGCVVAREVLAITREPGFLDNVNARAEQLGDGLAALREQHGALLCAVRQLGLMVGLELASEAAGQLFCRAAAEVGLFCVYANNDKRVVQFLLPLIATDTVVDEALDKVARTLTMLAPMLGVAG